MNLTRVGLVIVMAVLAVVATYALFRALDERAAPPIIIQDAEANLPIVVDLRGAVVTPGLYELPPNARVNDAIRAGGGLSQGADLTTINLARRLRDGEVVIIADQFRASPASGESLVDDQGPSGSESQAKLNINTATAVELELLPGIGEVTAARIVAFRQENGPYRSIDDLIHVQGISTKTIASFRELVTVAP